MGDSKGSMSVELFSSSSEERLPRPELTKNQNGVVLIPQPLHDRRDPLNWSFRRKCTIVATLSIAIFAGYAAPLVGQLSLIQQSKLYHKTSIEITYFVSKA
jgi:hypothetical protein